MTKKKKNIMKNYLCLYFISLCCTIPKRNYIIHFISVIDVTHLKSFIFIHA